MAVEYFGKPQHSKPLELNKEKAQQELAQLSNSEVHKKVFLYMSIINGALIGTAAYVKLAPVISQFLAR
jgi:hypothetical protein